MGAGLLDFMIGMSFEGCPLTETACVIFKPGKNWDGYFDNDDIIRQATIAMNICEEYYPNDNHIFIYDNATTHLKHADDALSA